MRSLVYVCYKSLKLHTSRLRRQNWTLTVILRPLPAPCQYLWPSSDHSRWNACSCGDDGSSRENPVRLTPPWRKSSSSSSSIVCTHHTDTQTDTHTQLDFTRSSSFDPTKLDPQRNWNDPTRPQIKTILWTRSAQLFSMDNDRRPSSLLHGYTDVHRSRGRPNKKWL